MNSVYACALFCNKAEMYSRAVPVLECRIPWTFFHYLCGGEGDRCSQQSKESYERGEGGVGQVCEQTKLCFVRIDKVANTSPPNNRRNFGATKSRTQPSRTHAHTLTHLAAIGTMDQKETAVCGNEQHDTKEAAATSMYARHIY